MNFLWHNPVYACSFKNRIIEEWMNTLIKDNPLIACQVGEEYFIPLRSRMVFGFFNPFLPLWIVDFHLSAGKCIYHYLGLVGAVLAVIDEVEPVITLILKHPPKYRSKEQIVGDHQLPGLKCTVPRFS